IGDHLESGGSLPPGMFNRASIAELLHEHRLGARDHSAVIWPLLSFAVWHDAYVRGSALVPTGTVEGAWPVTVKGVVIHPAALVEAGEIGSGTSIWAYVHVLKGARIGRDCNIGDHCYVEGGVRIGDEVVVKNGVSIWTGVTLEDRVFVGPNATF